MIHQVSVVPLKKVVNERGHLLEIQRADDPHFPGFGQAYVTMTFPSVVKAWYRHHKQIDQIALASGSLLLVLFDDRPESPTSGLVQQIQINEQAPLLVQIPTGVWHGFQAIGNDPACLLHLNSAPIDLENKDEDRLPHDDTGIPFRWKQ
jgi:dTDP-4-dehydrorhamnose 3,5-epimerase